MIELIFFQSFLLSSATVFATFQFENEYVDNDINVQLENMKVKMERVSVYVAGGTVYVLMLCEEPEGSK